MRLLAPLSKSLLPWKDAVATTAVAITVGQFLSGSLMCNDIRKRNSSAGFPLIPLLGGVVLCVLNLQYGFLIGDPALVRVNFIGTALHIVYCVFFYIYTPNEGKNKVWGQIGLAGAIVSAVVAYTQYEDPKLIEERLGLILTALLWALIASPFLGLGEIIRKKSVEGLPFPIIFCGTLVSFAWLAYGIVLNNDFLIVQNVVAVLMSVVQLSLFAIYPSTPSTQNDDNNQKKQKKKN